MLERAQKFRFHDAALGVRELNAECGRIRHVGRRVSVAVADLKVHLSVSVVTHADHQRELLSDADGGSDGGRVRPPALLQVHPDVDHVVLSRGKTGLARFQHVDGERTDAHGFGHAIRPLAAKLLGGIPDFLDDGVVLYDDDVGEDLTAAGRAVPDRAAALHGHDKGEA